MFDAEALPADALPRDLPQPIAPSRPRLRMPSLRVRLFAGLAAAVLIGAGAYGGDRLLVGGKVSTDNAYVGADVAQVTPLVSAPVRQVRVSDTQAVKTGDVLVVLDDTDARIALASAEAELGQAKRRVRGYLATDQSLGAQVAARAADQTRAVASVAAAKADMDRARIDLNRRQALVASGFVTGEEVTRVQNAFATAEANYHAAQAAQVAAVATRSAAVGSMNANAALAAGSPVDANPEVEAARAKVEQARVDLERTVIRAPIDGVVARRNVQDGQRVAAGAPVMQIVPVNQAYVDANFKEVQLKKVGIGQPVTLESDLYGRAIRYHGKVAGLAGGTGAAFALIPAQNATGNWIKVVQRLPVRIALDPAELRAHPLRVGLSMKATIDTAR